jgi:hypothetical protein
MRVAIILILQFVCVLNLAQTAKLVANSSLKPALPKTYFDGNDPFFLEDFINEQEKGNKQKIFDSLIKKSPSYKLITEDSLAYFLDSFSTILLSDTGMVCQGINTCITNQKGLKPKSIYVVWINKKAFYRVGYHPQKTLELINTFFYLPNIKSIEVVTPTPHTACLGKTKAHIYISTKSKHNLNYNIAGYSAKQMKIGRKWIGHN